MRISGSLVTISSSLLLVACGSALCLTTGAARAADATPSVRLEVRAAPNCTSVADLGARVRSRVPDIRFDAQATAFVASANFEILSTGDVAGELHLSTPKAAPSRRKVVARSCSQAADAVAVIIAVVLAPILRSEQRTADKAPSDQPDSGSVEKTSPPVGVPGPKSSKDGAAKPRDAAPSDARSPRSTLDDEHAEESVREVGPSRPRFGVQVRGQLLFGVAPATMPGVGLYGAVGVDRATLWSPLVMVGASHSWQSSQERGGTAQFALDAATIDACPLRLQMSALESHLCASALLGRLSAEGVDTSNSSGVARRPFVSLGGTVALSVRLHPIVELTAQGGARTNLVRDSFEFAPTVFHTVSDVSAFAGVGIGLRTR